MNVIVSNVNAAKFNSLDVDVIKSISGEFTADEIIQSFSNFFFNRMFLDITAIQNFRDVNTIKKLSVGLDVSKVILLLSDDSVVNSPGYISNLISMGIYNFAHDEDEVKYLYDNPNTYKDVAHLQIIDDGSKEETTFIEGASKKTESLTVKSGVRIIGFKNFTDHAGATSLIYMLKKQLSKNYYVVAIEVNKKDFMFFQDKDMLSCNEKELKNVISKYQDANVILVDLNDVDLSVCYSVCGDVINLMESSTLMINKAVMLDRNCFEKLFDQKVLLNRSLLSSHDVEILENESNIKFFGVLPPLNDREDNSNELFPLLESLKLYRKV